MKKIPLSQGKFAIVDDEDYDRLIAMGKWSYQRGYAVRTYREKTNQGVFIKKNTSMHRVLLNANEGDIIDHINGDRFDNRKSNLRICSNAQNIRNSGLRKNNLSGFKGVYFHKRTGKWYSQIRTDKKRLFLGSFETDIQAAIAYNAAALIHHGQFAKLNQI